MRNLLWYLPMGFFVWYVFYGLEEILNGGLFTWKAPLQLFLDEFSWNLPGGRAAYAVANKIDPKLLPSPWHFYLNTSLIITWPIFLAGCAMCVLSVLIYITFFRIFPRSSSYPK